MVWLLLKEMLSLKNVNAIAHFTDWIIAHVHVGALAWNGFMAFGMIYWLVPRMTKGPLFSTKLANFHFWIGTLGSYCIHYQCTLPVSCKPQCGNNLILTVL
jgi:cbb3-type cytochrome oxidase subunit 1